MLADLSLSDLARRLETREVTAEAALQACLERIAARNAELNAFIQVTGTTALQEARAADREIAAGRYRGPLHGVPISVKDIIDIQGLRTSAASRVRHDHVASHDAPIIARLRDASAVLVGKCNLHEFAFGTTNEDSAYGPSRNPHDPSRSPGGSSGGSAAAVATGMSYASIGTDTGGSIRIPSAACGIVGLKPGAGEISCEGVVPLCEKFDTPGPLARTVTDAWLVHAVLRGDGNPADVPGGSRTERVRLGVLRGYFMDLLDDGVARAFDRALSSLADGAALRDVEIAHAADIASVYVTIVMADAAAYHAPTLESRPEDYTAQVRRRLEAGRYVPAEDYARALRGREVLAGEVDRALEGVDALVLPTLPIPAPPLGAGKVKAGRESVNVRSAMLRQTQLFNMTGHPAITIPCGRTEAGLPCGLQLVGNRNGTDALVSVALACERRLATNDRG